jgi:diamine N-acetyltransferase
MLHGQNVVLRAWSERDIDALVALRNNIELQLQLMTHPRPNSAERVRKWLAAKSAREDAMFFVIASQSDDSVLGYLQVVNIRPPHGTAEIGICVAPHAQGKGMGNETIRLVEAYLRGTFGLRKIVLYVLADNVRAIAFYDRCAFKSVGRLAQHFRSGIEYHDVVIMEKLLVS